MKLVHKFKSEPQNIEQEISNDEVWNRCAQSFSKIIMIEYLTSTFIIPCSIFVIRFLAVSFSIKLVAFLASGGTYTLNLIPYTINFLATRVRRFSYTFYLQPFTFNLLSYTPPSVHPALWYKAHRASGS